MRILRVAQDVFPEVVGGAPYHVHALSRDQASRGHDVTVLTVSDETDEPNRETRDGYTLVRTSSKVDLFGNKLFADTLGHLRDEEYDVIHAHSHLFYSSNVAAAYGRFDDTPLAVTCHGLDSQRTPEWLSKAHLRTVGRWTYNTADVVFCYTPTEREILHDIGVTGPVRVVENGVDTERFSPTGDSAERIDDVDRRAILFVGRLVGGKHPQDLLDAFDRVHEEYPDAALFYCGGGPLQERLESRTAEAGLDDDVEFLGHVPYERMPSVYRAADLVVLTSRTEGLPRTVLEALACETPVVSTRLDQIVPIVERAGETVPVGDVDALATTLVEILDSPGRLRELGAAGRDVIAERYDWSSTVGRTTEALGELVEAYVEPTPGKPSAQTTKPLLAEDRLSGGEEPE